VASAKPVRIRLRVASARRRRKAALAALPPHRSYRNLSTRNRREEKLHAAANLLANLLLRPGNPAKVPYEELDHLVRCVDALSIGAIAVLGAAGQIGKRTGPPGSFNFPELKNSFRKFEQSFLMSLVSELRNFNLVDIHGGAIQLQDFSHVQLRLTPIEQRLVERFIEGHM
jgi:hypothetical protein